MKLMIIAILSLFFILVPNAMAETSFEIDGFDVNITSDQTGHLRLFINNSTHQVWTTLNGMETGTMTIPIPELEINEYVIKVTINDDIVELPFSLTQELIDETLAREQADLDEEQRLQNEEELAQELEDEENARQEAEIAELQEVMEEQPPVPIPSWVKGIAGFYANGEINDDEFKEAIRFLVNNGILVL